MKDHNTAPLLRTVQISLSRIDTKCVGFMIFRVALGNSDRCKVTHYTVSNIFLGKC